ncbi:MAG TPA: NUDIX hydrolase [Candidatus Paceibacterota bacterium]|nr:NUDIX hydrolase [Candidatus Paceibacterota bacterium]
MHKSLIVHTLIHNAEHKVLILKRAKVNDVLPEYWDIPGGTLEDGENPVAGAIRETKEETDLDIAGLQLFFEYSTIDDVKDTQFVTLVFAAKYSGGEVTLHPEEHEEYAWIAPDEIGKYKTVNYLEGALRTFSKLEDLL